MEDDIRARILELQNELKELDKRAEEERQARKASVKREWRFTIAPQESSWVETYDDAVRVYSLRGEVVNAAECRAVGYSDDHCRGGGMSYYFNTATGRIIASTGGGSVFLSVGRWADKKNEPEGYVALQRLNRFLVENPEGGDVTEIITAQTNLGWLK